MKDRARRAGGNGPGLAKNYPKGVLLPECGQGHCSVCLPPMPLSE